MTYYKEGDAKLVDLIKDCEVKDHCRIYELEKCTLHKISKACGLKKTILSDLKESLESLNIY